MQGKFQMQVLPAVGHTVHEDSPDKVPFSISIFFNFTKWPFLNFYSFFLIFLYLRWPRCSPLSSSAISWPVPLRRSNPSELSTGFPWEDSPWHLHPIIQLLALESNQPDSCLPHPRLSSLGKSDSQNCPSSFKGEIAKADFQLFLILDPPRTLVKILYFDNYKQICAQYPPNLQDLCKLLLITTCSWHFNYFTWMQVSGIISQIAIHHLETKNNWSAVLFSTKLGGRPYFVR